MYLRILLLLILMFGYSCEIHSQSKTNELQNVMLEETEDLIISHIEKAIYSNNNNILYICDTKSNKIFAHNIATGKAEYSISPSISFSDSIMISYPSCQIVEGKEVYFVSLKEISNNNPDIKISNYLKHQFKNIFEIDNYIYALTLVYAPAVLKKDSLHQIITNHAVLIKFDKKLQLVEFIPLENIYGVTHALAINMAHIDSKYIVTTGDFAKQFQRQIYDSLPSLTEYTNTGKLVSNLVFLPEIYLKSKVGYLSSQYVNLVSTDNDVCYIYPTYPYLNFINSGKSIPMHNISEKNNHGFENFNQEMELSIEKYERAFPISVNQLFTDNNFLYAQVLNLKFNNNKTIRKGIIQKYDLDGNFIASTEIGDYNTNKIKYIGYAKPKDCFFVIKLDNETGWTLEYIDFF